VPRAGISGTRGAPNTAIHVHQGYMKIKNLKFGASIGVAHRVISESPFQFSKKIKKNGRKF
jgi:hypothetical protein